MKLKENPEDFRVTERIRWNEEPGEYRVYRLEKRGVTTFDAIRRLAARAGVGVDRIHYAGLKDRQGVTTQHLAIAGAELFSLPDLTVTLLGRAARPLSSDDLLGNDFVITARHVALNEVANFEERIAEVARYGLPNYFDDQRFGGLTQGGGLIGRELARGRLEEATRLYLLEDKAKNLGSHAARDKARRLWGFFPELARLWGHRPGIAMIRHLGKRPDDFAGAWQRLPGKERAFHLFAYQSWLWNRTVASLLSKNIPAADRVAIPSVLGPLPCWRTKTELTASVPLLDGTTPIADERIRIAVDDVLRSEGFLRRADLRTNVAGTSFQYEERPLVLRVEDLVIREGPTPEGRCTVAFSLPPGAYATLVMRRLFEAR